MPGRPGYAALSEAARARHLDVFGLLHPGPEDGAPPGARTLLLLGPDGARFWPALTASPEWRDGAPDPVDRWSARVIGGWAASLGAQAVFPSDGPPYPPFLAWARASGRAWPSPVGLLVHDTAGLWVSYRGALALPWRVEGPELPQASPCESCAEQPCRTACPVDALSAEAYLVEACRAHVSSPEGAPCMSGGCRVRAACPVSRRHGRPDVQSAYHMRAFARP